jgi:hypothetical protein
MRAERRGVVRGFVGWGGAPAGVRIVGVHAGAEGEAEHAGTARQFGDLECEEGGVGLHRLASHHVEAVFLEYGAAALVCSDGFPWLPNSCPAGRFGWLVQSFINTGVGTRTPHG